MTEKEQIENINQQLALINCAVGLLIVNKIISADELSKLSPFGYKETQAQLDKMKDFIPALLANWEKLKELNK